MRRALVFVAMAVAAGSFGTGHAAGELAKCDGTTGLTNATYYPTIGGTCQKSFKITQPMTVAINLIPSLTFTGTLKGRVTGGPAGGNVVTGTFVSGVLVSGLSSGIAYLVPYHNGTQVDWRLTVTAGDPQTPCLPYTLPPVSCSPVALPTFGFGAFSGSITPAPAGEPGN